MSLSPVHRQSQGTKTMDKDKYQEGWKMGREELAYEIEEWAKGELPAYCENKLLTFLKTNGEKKPQDN
jgi:hypothetical protein